MSSLPSLLPPAPWSSPGIASRPDYCRNCCPYGSVSTGFVLDYYPPTPKLALMYAYPSKDDVIERGPFSGSSGAFYASILIEKAGFKCEDVLLSTLLRCRPPKARNKWADDIYPTGDLRRRVELACRHWDGFNGSQGEAEVGGINKYAPNLFIITFGLNKLLQVPAFQRLAEEDVAKGFRWAEKGYRPMILMGIEAMELVAPWLSGKGGVKAWRGTHFPGYWPFKDNTALTPTRTFLSATNRWRR